MAILCTTLLSRQSQKLYVLYYSKSVHLLAIVHDFILQWYVSTVSRGG